MLEQSLANRRCWQLVSWGFSIGVIQRSLAAVPARLALEPLAASHADLFAYIAPDEKGIPKILAPRPLLVALGNYVNASDWFV